MATGWVKSLHCKSSKTIEGVHNPIPKHLLPPIASASCRMSVQALKDVIESTAAAKPKPKARKLPKPRSPSSPKMQKSASMPQPGQQARIRHSGSVRAAAADPCLPALKELPHGHPSRNVVEIIFHTSWSPKALPGRIEMVFKIQNASRTVARFEEYREMVKARAGSGEAAAAARESDDNARCVADGNEVMRFHCLGPTSGSAGLEGGAGAAAWAFPGGGGKVKGAAMCTFSGSGDAHERGGGGRGRRAMLVCRVVAGRVGKRLGRGSFVGGRVGFDSVSGDDGELLVFDSRAVLPCFLVIYKL